MVHELAHALGFAHEQSRDDRNDWVVIQRDNILSGKGHNLDASPAACSATSARTTTPR